MHGSGKERNRLKVCVIKAVQAELSENALSKMSLEPSSSIEHPAFVVLFDHLDGTNSKAHLGASRVRRTERSQRGKVERSGPSCQGPWRPVRELVFILGNQKPLKSFKPCYGEQICI